jgi:Thioredoxin.
MPSAKVTSKHLNFYLDCFINFLCLFRNSLNDSFDFFGDIWLECLQKENWFVGVSAQLGYQKLCFESSNQWIISITFLFYVYFQLKGENVDLVKMDATANDVPSLFEVRGFPTLFWLPKNSKSKPVKYEVSLI